MQILDTTYAALSDPTRRAILARLSLGEATVGEIAAPFPISGPAISRHLKVLEQADLIGRTRRGQQRICRLNPQGLKGARDWLEEMRAIGEGSLDRVEARLQHKPEPEENDAHAGRR